MFFCIYLVSEKQVTRSCPQSRGWDCTRVWISEGEDHQGHLKICLLGFPGGAVVENLPANAGDTGSSPGLRRSHKPQSNQAREPELLSLRVWSLCSTMREAATVRDPHTAMKSGPRLPRLEKDLTQKRTPSTTKGKKKKSVYKRGKIKTLSVCPFPPPKWENCLN